MAVDRPTLQDADLLLKLFQEFEGDAMYASRQWLLHEMKATTIEEFRELYPENSAENRHFFRVYRFFEMTGTLYKNGLVHPDLLFDIWYVNQFYHACYPIIMSIRSHGDKHVAENFEFLAMAELDWIAKAKGPDIVPDLPYRRK
ncbi:transposase [Tumebacillus sp. ITR2]|uniref:Transposase n=1 Tax=Tumebacillus amylolyticus TaxID=2801339 RepID=A0ABS1JC00_9BACL|nr:transposase [Tumebacillus amylolyticus]